MRDGETLTVRFDGRALTRMGLRIWRDRAVFFGLGALAAWAACQ
jgi:hypothetical protein